MWNKDDLKEIKVPRRGKFRTIVTYREDGSNGENKTKEFHNNFMDSYSYVIENELNDSIHSYRINRNIFTCMKIHANSRTFIKVDIKEYFSSINQEILLTALKKELNIDEKTCRELLASLDYHNCGIGINIGLIPSAPLSNLYLNKFDLKLIQILANINNNLKYTRYADDIIISCEEKLNKEACEIIVGKVAAELKEYGLVLQDRKTLIKVFDFKKEKHPHFKALGIVISAKKVNEEVIFNYSISRQYRKKASASGQINFLNYAYTQFEHWYES